MGAGQYGQDGSPTRPYGYQTPTASTPRSMSQPTRPTTSPAGTHHAMATTATTTTTDYGSPQAAHPYPIAARHILTPKSPRSVSTSRTAQHHPTSSLQGTVARGTTSAYEPQAHGHGPSPLGTPPQFYTSASAPGRAAPSPPRPSSGLARSLSQPSLSHDFSRYPTLEPLQPGGIKREHGGRPVLSGPPFPAQFPAVQPYNMPGGLGDGRWGPGLLSSMSAGAARGFSIADGQPMLTITPRHGEEILVAVDVHQGSRQADQKRQRNAGASARFRQRKKEREKEQLEELQKLDAENRELEKRNEELFRRCQELEAHREFYRADRNRLRDVLSQLPGGREWAERGPPSPVARNAGGPSLFATDNGALQHHHHHQPPPSVPHPQSQQQHHHSHHHNHHSAPFRHAAGQNQNHNPAPRDPRPASYSDRSSLEPPARRRRTDSEPQLPTSSYSLMQGPSPLPSMAHSMPPPAFSIPPSPHVTPPPPGNARLPPLRFDPQGRTPSVTPPPILPAPQPQVVPSHSSAGSPYVSTRRLPYETGWATEPGPDGAGGGSSGGRR